MDHLEQEVRRTILLALSEDRSAKDITSQACISKESSAHPVIEAIRRARILQPQARIEIEIENLSALEEAIEGKADVILLDNMDAATVAEAVKISKGKAYLEASGGITLSNAREYASTGVNGISIGSLTHSVTAVDISLRVDS